MVETVLYELLAAAALSNLATAGHTYLSDNSLRNANRHTSPLLF